LESKLSAWNKANAELQAALDAQKALVDKLTKEKADIEASLSKHLAESSKKQETIKVELKAQFEQKQKESEASIKLQLAEKEKTDLEKQKAELQKQNDVKTHQQLSENENKHV